VADLAFANLGVDRAKQEVQQARGRFHAGVASSIEVITAHYKLARANDSQIATLCRYTRPGPIWPTPPDKWRRFTPGR